MSKPKIGLIKEGKFPPDYRVALTPLQCKGLIEQGWDIKVQKSEVRCYSDQEFLDAGVPVVYDISACDILIGIKEVPVEQLIDGKTYFIFSHTMKKQAHNRKLLQAIVKKRITLIDYEMITDDNNERLIAFGYYAGIVGAHMGIAAYGERTGSFDLSHMDQFPHYEDAVRRYKDIKFPPIKVVLTGKGRVGSGAAKVLDDMGFRKLSASEYLNATFDYPVYTQLDAQDYVKSEENIPFTKQDYYNDPKHFLMDFKKYLAVSDIFINGIYWDNRSPAFFKLKDLKENDFKVKVIADITCDIAPDSSVPTTIKASTILEPVYGFNKLNLVVCEPNLPDSVDVMAIDNLPNALPRDSSQAFGEKLIKFIIPELTKNHSEILIRATITKNGVLTPKYSYLQDYVDEEVHLGT